MSDILPRLHGRPYIEHAVAVRIEGRGYLYCDGCGASTVTRYDLAHAAGVTEYVLTKFLHKRPVTPEQEKRIREHLLRVEEQ